MNLNTLSDGARQNLLRRRGIAVSSPASASASKSGSTQHANNSKENIIANAARRRLSGSSSAAATKQNTFFTPPRSHTSTRSTTPATFDTKPTLLQRRKMEPLSPIMFNFESPTNGFGFVGKTYIKSRPTSSANKAAPKSSSPTAKKNSAQRVTPMSAKLAAIKKRQSRSFRGGTPQNVATATQGKAAATPPLKQTAFEKQRLLSEAKQQQKKMLQQQSQREQQQAGQIKGQHSTPRKYMKHQQLRQQALKGGVGASVASPTRKKSSSAIDSKLVTPPKYPMSSAPQLALSPAMQKMVSMSPQLALSPAMQNMLNKYGEGGSGAGNTPDTNKSAAPTTCGTPNSYMSLASKRAMIKNGRGMRSSSAPRAGRDVNTVQKPFKPETMMGGVTNDSQVKQATRTSNNNAGTPLAMRRGRYAEMMELKNRSRSLSMTSGTNDGATNKTKEIKSPVKSTRGRPVTRADIGNRTTPRSKEGPSFSSSPLPPTGAARAGGGTARGRHAAMIEMQKRKARRASTPTSSRLQREHIGEKGKLISGGSFMTKDVDKLINAMSTLTTVSAALDSDESSLCSKASKSQQLQNLTPRAKIERMKKHLDKNRFRSVGGGSVCSHSHAKNDESATSPLPPRCSSISGSGSGNQKLTQQQKLQKAKGKLSSYSSRARSLSIPRDVSLQRSPESVPSSVSGLESVPSSELGQSGLGVTQSCSFTNANNNGSDELTQLQLKRRRAREVLARRNKG